MGCDSGSVLREHYAIAGTQQPAYLQTVFERAKLSLIEIDKSAHQ
jgi:hypothetical protein